MRKLFVPTIAAAAVFAGSAVALAGSGSGDAPAQKTVKAKKRSPRRWSSPGASTRSSRS